MSLDRLKKDMSMMFKLSNEIGKYNQMLLQHINEKDKYNFNLKKAELIETKIQQLEEQFYLLKNKWF